MNNENVSISNNKNLDDPKFRARDGIHLTQHGTAVLANNIKYAVAKALNVKVEKKFKGNDGGFRRERNYTAGGHRGYDNYDNSGG